MQPEKLSLPAVRVAFNGRYESGFSDTLWVGRDHYTPCFHIAGLPEMVAYKADGTAPGKLLVVEVRDELPDSNSPVSAMKTEAVTQPHLTRP